jgi:hypothetical protein
VALGVTEQVDLQTLAAFLSRPEIGCIDAIRLTGQNTAGLVVNGEKFGNDAYLYPSVIAVLPRQ